MLTLRPGQTLIKVRHVINSDGEQSRLIGIKNHERKMMLFLGEDLTWMEKSKKNDTRVKDPNFQIACNELFYTGLAGGQAFKVESLVVPIMYQGKTLVKAQVFRVFKLEEVKKGGYKHHLFFVETPNILSLLRSFTYDSLAQRICSKLAYLQKRSSVIWSSTELSPVTINLDGHGNIGIVPRKSVYLPQNPETLPQAILIASKYFDSVIPSQKK